MRPLTAITLTFIITLTTYGAGPPAPRVRPQPPPRQTRSAAAEDLDALNRRVRELYEAEKYEEASKLAQTALGAAERQSGPDSWETSAALMNLASVQVARRDMTKAGESLARLVEMRARRTGPSRKFEQSALELFTCIDASNLRGGPDLEMSRRIYRILAEDSVLEQGYRLSPGKAELKVGENLSKPQPEYPSAALRARATGAVVLRITVDEEGRVAEAIPLGCSAKMLVEAAAAAARVATFKPTLVDGRPVKVRGIIFYRFVIM